MRGCARKVIVLKGTAQEMFDEAYFLLRPNFEGRTKEDILRAAERIVDRNTTRKRRSPFSLRDALFFALGTTVGSLFALLGIWIF